MATPVNKNCLVIAWVDMIVRVERELAATSCVEHAQQRPGTVQT